MTTPTDLKIYLFDLQGYLLREGALTFVDAISHGSAIRVNEGRRRTAVFRYGPSWGFFRHGYRPSRELLGRLTPDRRQIVWPHRIIEGAPYGSGR